ncbi:MAG: type II toxin-antitoxin system VapC family toxin [Thermomicrobiales bacterium]|nr:type II toxin-antitoxin system VapC family toxin [Thermomicrobiales bacterium]
MSFLLDTNVVSELARPAPDGRVVEYVEGIDPGDIFLSAITIGELARGVSLLPDGRRKASLGAWVTGLELQFQTRILPVDREVARFWGELTARAQQRGVVISTADGLIAATAVHHGLRIVTRNTRHFEASGVAVINPWAGS